MDRILHPHHSHNKGLPRKTGFWASSSFSPSAVQPVSSSIRLWPYYHRRHTRQSTSPTTLPYDCQPPAQPPPARRPLQWQFLIPVVAVQPNPIGSHQKYHLIDGAADWSVTAFPLRFCSSGTNLRHQHDQPNDHKTNGKADEEAPEILFCRSCDFKLGVGEEPRVIKSVRVGVALL